MEVINKIKSFFSSSKSYSYDVSSSYGKSSWSFFGGWGRFNSNREKEEKLIEEGYISNEDIYSVIDKLIKTASTIPIQLKVKENDEYIVLEDKSNDFYRLLNKPNQNQTQKEYRVEQYINYLLTGDSFEWKIEAAGFNFPTSLKIVPSQFTKINVFDCNDYFSEIKNYEFCWGSKIRKFGPEEIIHTKNIDPSYCEDRKGLSPLQPAYTSLSASNQVHKAEEKMIENGGARGMISSNNNDYPLSFEEKKKLDDEFKERAGGAENYNKTITTSSNVKYQTLGVSPKELALTDIDVSKLRKFCSVFGLSSQLFNDPANSTYNNVSESKASLYTESAIPLAQLFVDAWNEKLTPVFNEEDKKEYMVVLDSSKIEVLQSDQKQEAEKNKIVSESISSIASQVTLNQLDSETAKKILVFSYGMTEEQAEELIPNNPITQNQTDSTNEG